MRVLAALGVWLLCAAAALLGLAWMLAAMLAGSQRAWRIAVGFDAMASVTTGGDWPELVSDRAYDNREVSRAWRAVYRLILAADPDHFAYREGR